MVSLNNSRPFWLLVAAVFVTPYLCAAEPAMDSWPQWGGPNRDHKSLATDLLQEWPLGGPKMAWKFEQAGVAYSSPAVANGRLYSMGTDQGKNFVFCLDCQTGKEIWRNDIGEAPPQDSYQGAGGGRRRAPDDNQQR